MVERHTKSLVLGGGTLLAGALVVAGCAQHLDAIGSPRSERWSEEQIAVLASLRIDQLGSVPADPSNRFERQPATVAFGKRLFFDPRLSRNQAVSCSV